MAWWRHGQEYLRTGRNALALTTYRKLVQEFSAVPALWLELGAAAAAELEFAPADQAFQKAISLAPNDLNLLLSAGAQYWQMRRMDAACDCFERATAANPSSFQARQLLATSLEKKSRLDEAFETIETYLSSNPKEGRALYFKAFLLHRKGLNKEAETLLRALVQSAGAKADILADAYHLLGLLMDGFGQYSEALAFIERSKLLKSQLANTTAREQAYVKLIEARRAFMHELTGETIRRWREEAAALPSAQSLALLGGSPRSGTTLIEQILGAHPDIAICDEAPCFAKEILGPLNNTSAWLNAPGLDGLRETERQRLSARYLKSVSHETQQSAPRLILDKNPSTTAWLPYWLRLFPQSKVIVALRDPRDIIISCYFRNIPIEDFSAISFINLDRTARNYTDTMEVWLRMKELGGFDWLETRYEDVVVDLEAEGRRMMNFLGLPWDPSQARFYESAHARDVHSPTYHEVRQPIFHRAVQRWKHYAEALAPLQSRLEPYLRAFGYE